VFETVPLAREVKAIRRAVEDEHQLTAEKKPWWVCTIYPGGEIPEEHPGEEHRQISCHEIHPMSGL
jgi:homocysteine S-methyltransferase